ncbi:hypothetical protein HJC23_009656 [Cyclotella cryptica]|uniref:Timeless N-terminal domain-containing protein n=1 Tax=Cyclotella cryptica TaxID=29204 RepID=A0ABD3PW08_9STRA|eukprot:CCRYP_010916-RA/>CCRYP_010916-RA protein AED:0.12 eAED:0.12 QI:154/1/1/1/1/1/5/272/1007
MPDTKQPQSSPTSVAAAPSQRKLSKTARKSPIIPEMTVDKRIIDELLLVCSVIGSSDPNGKFVPVTDCLAWLQDLQRALRRDNDAYRPIALLLGQWNVVKTKLLPLVMSCRYDRGVVLTVLKILVILTKPLSDSAKRAGRQTIDVKSGKVDESVIQEQIKLRENAIAQSDLLMDYKRMIVEHPSHRYAFRQPIKPSKSRHNEDANDTTELEREGGLLSIFTSLLAEPLSTTNRTASDHLQIELVLHFVRNILSIQPMTWCTEGRRENHKLSGELVVLLEKEMVLKVLVCVGQEVEKRENEGYNLLLMEILSCLLKGQDPSDVAESSVLSTKQPSTINATNKPTAKMTASKEKASRTIVATKTTASTSLRSHLQSEREKLTLQAPSRHSHFGGTLLVSSQGKKGYVSATDYLTKPSSALTSRHQPPRRKNKKTEVFIGSTKSISSSLDCGPIGHKAKSALNSFCHKFVKQCYGPAMKSWKNEFRRDSNRLEDGDRTMFFQIVWFFHRWWRLSQDNLSSAKEMSSESSNVKSIAHNLIFTMDVFMFNLVLNSTDEYYEHKKHTELAQTVALYGEMLRLLEAMYNSSDATERMMALGLMDRIFYAAEPLDRLPRLLSRWSAGMFGREYLVDLVECCHVVWKLLDGNAERCVAFFSDDTDKNRPKDAVERMNITASEFDKETYFARKFVSNHIVFMYTQLLSQYASNEPHVNRHVVAYFIRICKFNIKLGDVDHEYDRALEKNDLATKQSTFEPILYNIGVFTVLENILNDAAIRGKEEFSALLMFASSFMKRFARATAVNPMLFVEALFRHPIPHRFCELTTNLYVNEELRMIAVRDLLVEDQKRYEQAKVYDVAVETPWCDDADDEVEFDGKDMDENDFVAKKKSKHRKKHTSLSSIESNSDDKHATDNKEEEAEFNGSDVTGPIAASEKENDGDVYEDSGIDVEGNYVTVIPTEPRRLERNQSPPPTLNASGKKRIRKTLPTLEDDSEDEDFSCPTKVLRRVIFEDDE